MEIESQDADDAATTDQDAIDADETEGDATTQDAQNADYAGYAKVGTDKDAKVTWDAGAEGKREEEVREEWRYV